MPIPPHTSATKSADLDAAVEPGRAFCYRCHKACSTCVCESIPVIDNRTEVLVVQHPAEQRHPVGTVRFARLGLARCEVAVAAKGEDGALRTPRPFPPGAALLYPGEGAQTLSSLAPSERPRALVVLDGTWSTVRPLLAGDARLRSLPRVCIAPTVAGRYRIRREPRLECVSTIEALVAALRILEPERGADLDALVGAFDRMIDQQIAIVAARGRPRRRTPATRPQFRAVPAELGLRGGAMVVAHVESTQVNRRAERSTRQRRQIVSLHATRLCDDNAVTHFAALVAIEGDPPSDAQLRFLGVTRSALQAGCSATELAATWAAFVHPGDRLCAWNQMTLDLLAPLLPAAVAVERSQRYVLKGIYADLTRRRAGALESACARAGLCPDSGSGHSRGRMRLAAAVAIYEWLAAQAGRVPD